MTQEQHEAMDTLSTRVTRSSSRSVSPATDKNTEAVKASVKRTPSRRGRPKKSRKPTEEVDVSETPSTPTRSKARSTSRESEVSEDVNTPRRRTKSSSKTTPLAPSPTRTTDLGDEAALTPSRRTRGAVARAARVAGVDGTESSERATTPTRSTRSKSAHDESTTHVTPETPSRRTRSARATLNDSKSKTPEKATPSRTRSLRTKANMEDSEKAVGTPVRRGRSFRASATVESNDKDTEVSEVHNIPRRGRSGKILENVVDSNKLDIPEATTPTRRGRSSKSAVAETPEKVTPSRMGRNRKDAAEENITPTNNLHNTDIAATPVKKSEEFKKSTLNESLLNESTAGEKSVRNTPRRTPSRRVKAVAENAESNETVRNNPVRRTPSRRGKATVVEADFVADANEEPHYTSRAVRRTPSQRVKAVIDEAELEKSLLHKSMDTSVVDEPHKSPGRKTRSKPKLVVTPIDNKAGGDADVAPVNETDGRYPNLAFHSHVC